VLPFLISVSRFLISVSGFLIGEESLHSSDAPFLFADAGFMNAVATLLFAEAAFLSSVLPFLFSQPEVLSGDEKSCDGSWRFHSPDDHDLGLSSPRPSSLLRARIEVGFARLSNRRPMTPESCRAKLHRPRASP
jgi:hypothetical protein